MSIRYGSSSYVAEVDYDPEIIQKFADQMYTQATLVVWLYMLFAGAGGCWTAYLLGPYAQKVPYAAAGALVGGILGFLSAQPRAFQLRLQAQTALCQMRIEANTREQRDHVRLR